MSKRFTDTDKWKKQWFRELSPEHKNFWVYICDNCNHAGIWDVDFKLAEFIIGKTLNISEIERTFQKQYISLNNGKKWFIRDFVDFQYGILKPESRTHQSVIDILKKERVYKEYTKGIQRHKDKGTVKDKVLDKDKAKEVIEDFNIVFGTAYKMTNLKTIEIIQDRFNEGFSLEDFKTVHRKMLKNWGADTKMYKFLRPQTLYSFKFESYLNMREQYTKLTEIGIKAYFIGQEWLKKQQEKENVK